MRRSRAHRMISSAGRSHARLVAAAALCALVAFLAPASALAAGGGSPHVKVSEPHWVVPASNLPPGVSAQAGNNNVAIAMHKGRLFMAWRTGPFHFASSSARLYVVSSANNGRIWDFEREVYMGTDLREPFLVSFKGRLILTFFRAGTNPLAFEPQHMWRTVRNGRANWTAPETWGEEGEVPWAFKVHEGKVYATTYKGPHYSTDPAVLEVRFYVSDDGLDWRPVGTQGPVVYRGGVSEVGFDFDAAGNLWGVTRSEDGDATGFGSHLVSAPAADLAAWQFPATCDPNIYESPRMFRHGDDLYLIARRDPCSPYDMGWNFLPFDIRRLVYLAAYSLRPKRTALFRIDTASRKVVWVRDLPGCGDTAFASIIQTGPDSFLVANYTSPLWFTWRTWLAGQISIFGTRIYFVRLDFA